MGFFNTNNFRIAKATVPPSFSTLLYEYQPWANLGIINLVPLLYKMKTRGNKTLQHLPESGNKHYAELFLV